MIINNELERGKYRVKYFVKGWYENSNKAKKTIEEYNHYYKSIENQLSASVKNILRDRHDTHIMNTYFIENNYIMELEEHIWGKANIIFHNATVKHSNDIKDEYWLYDEIYKVLDKIELHILLNKSEIIIICDDAYITVEDKAYFKNLYIKEDYNINIMDNKDNIASTILNKEKVCGFIMLNSWEQLIYSFIQVYMHIRYYKYNNIDDKLENHYYKCYPNLSPEGKQKIYEKLFIALEEKLINSIKILEKYKHIIKEKELDSMINKFLEIYNKKDVSVEDKNQLYLNLGEQITFDLCNIYKRILECINADLIK
ncbi:MAG: DUF4085 family protein [Clostridia bacterium]